MKIPIKFRGRRPSGEWIYGSYVKGEKYSYIIDNEHGQCLVEPGSVAQLVGYDKNGDEVYEGDVLEFDTPDLQDHTKVWHYEYKAHMKGFATTADGCYIPSEKFVEKTLKK